MSEYDAITTEQINIYVSLASDLDKILTKLTKSICSNDCPRAETEGKDSLRCCGSKFVYKSGINSDEFLERQMAEAFDHGWQGETTDGCQYLIKNKGCSLKSYKSPLCLGFVCPGIMSIIQEQYGSKGLEFTENMIEFGVVSDLSTKLEASKTLERLETVVKIGYELI